MLAVSPESEPLYTDEPSALAGSQYREISGMTGTGTDSASCALMVSKNVSPVTLSFPCAFLFAGYYPRCSAYFSWLLSLVTNAARREAVPLYADLLLTTYSLLLVNDTSGFSSPSTRIEGSVV